MGIKLTKGGGTFATSGTAILTFGNVRSFSSRKSANLINLPLPASDSSERLAFDLLGVTREITFSGVHTSGATGSAIDFTYDLDTLVDGGQGDTGSGQVGYSCQGANLSGSITVYVNDANWDMEEGSPDKVAYNVTLYEVSSSSG